METHLYRNDVVTSNAESLILYLASGYREDQLELLINRLDEFRSYLSAFFTRNGPLRITNSSVLFTFRKKEVGWG